MKYILILEDGETLVADSITEDDKYGCDAGILDVIDVTTMSKYFEGEWHKLLTAEEMYGKESE